MYLPPTFAPFTTLFYHPVTCLNHGNSIIQPSYPRNHTTYISLPTGTLSLFPQHVYAYFIESLPAASLKQPTLIQDKKAFIPADGCGENTLLLDHVIRQARKYRHTLSIVGIDLAKAFNSVSHNSITCALGRHSVDEPMVQYILQSYSNCTTTILCGPANIPNVKLLQGVKQGDPLSPIIFNLILDELLDILLPSIGINITPNLRFNCLTFADDLILLSESPSTMKILINITTSFFSARSMKISANKWYRPQCEEPHYNQCYRTYIPH